ncbi:MAG: rod shape-determining protein MreD [Firmicutes bacterium]|nr:rod shape-determining protein MreD [Bacillota bacterium]
MAPVIIFLLFVLSLALQGSVFALAGPSGTHPDILLIITVALALLSDERRGAIVGLCAGLFQDILFGSPLGFFAAVKMLAGTIAGLLSDYIYKDVTLAPMILTVGFTFFSDLVTFFLLKLFNIGASSSLLVYLYPSTLQRMVLHFLIMGLIYPYLYRAQKKQLLFAEREEEE